MNQGQTMFLNFILERAKNEKQKELKRILLESFEQQKTTPLTKTSFEELSLKLLSLIREDAIFEVQTAMNHFASAITQE